MLEKIQEYEECQPLEDKKEEIEEVLKSYGTCRCGAPAIGPHGICADHL